MVGSSLASRPEAVQTPAVFARESLSLKRQRCAALVVEAIVHFLRGFDTTVLVGLVLLDFVQVREDLQHGLGVLRKPLWIHAPLDGLSAFLLALTPEDGR